jgi:3-hydroxypropanoate dehydrogenase
MTTARDEELNLLFSEARTHNVWLDRPVDDATLRRLYDLVRMGPTGGNTQPLRVVFVKSAEAKERLRPVLAPANVDKAMSAPVTAIIAYDSQYFELMPKLFPSRPEMRELQEKMPRERRNHLAILNSTLQAGFLLLAARALGLDCGPMGGFDTTKTDAEFFPDGRWRSTLLVNLGYGDETKLRPRNPRLDFDDACRIV